MSVCRRKERIEAVWKLSVWRRERRVGKWAGSTQRAPRAGKSSAVVKASRWKRIDAAWGVARGKRRALQFQCGSSEGAAEIIVGVAVAARKARTSEPENRFDLSCRRATPEQVLGDPLIGDTPVGWRETLRDSQAQAVGGTLLRSLGRPCRDSSAA